MTGTVVLESEGGFVTLSYSQRGLSVRGPERRDEIRWDTEPELRSGDRGEAEEWIELIPLENQSAVPELPFAVDAVRAWFGIGSYVETLGIALTSAARTLVLATTDAFDLNFSTLQQTRHRAELVAANMNMCLIEQECRI
ncbi:hypothetical protein F5X71_16540 [Nocardia brasiliensis]|uniref:Uncharacterized protein n=1 Tax=Nocardia brasiliensis TaxID=37326 RepID=A0A6G9XS25_NOCBR|nr:hypothetical protein [Nocardia brasiliensis]QIS03717.1 hypothetical protein F5X71_16540 [Nocardia brasiliensis]